MELKVLRGNQWSTLRVEKKKLNARKLWRLLAAHRIKEKGGD